MFQEFVMRVWRALWPKPKKPVKKRKPLTRHPSLDRAIARISRAEEHLADLMRRTALRGQEQVNAMAIQPHPNEPKQILIKRGEVPLDHGFSILVGEIVYNLRSALDYLTFELACLDTGLDIEGSQFPIESKRKRFKSRINGGWLDGLNSAHVAAIEALQPYRGCQCAAILRAMSNPAKN